MSSEEYSSVLERARRGAFFAAEGVDIENAMLALEDIESSLSALEGLYGEASWKRRLFTVRYPFAAYAAPLGFLRAFLAAERARRACIAAPSESSIRALAAAWKTCAEAYLSGARAYRTMLRTLIRIESSERTFSLIDMFGFVSTYENFDAMCALIEENGRALVREARGAPIASPRAPRRPLPKLPSAEVDAWCARMHEEEVRGGVSPFRHADIEERFGPFSYTLACMDGTPAAHAFRAYTLRERGRGMRLLWISLADRFHLYDMRLRESAPDGMTRGGYAAMVGLKPEEVSLWYEPATHFYSTRDVRHWCDIASALDAARRPALDLSQVEAQRSNALDTVLAALALDTQLLIGHMRRRARAGMIFSFSCAYDFLMRSVPALTFLTFNDSVWRLGEREALFGARFVGTGGEGVLSPEAARAACTPEEIRKIMGLQALRERRGKEEGWLG